MKRIVLALVVVLGLVGGVAAAGSRPEAANPFFTQLAPPGPPFVPTGNFVTSTWYCPGTPARGSDGTSRFGGEVVVTNPTDVPITGRLRLVSVGQAPVQQEVSVGAHERQVFTVDQLVTADFASAIVELDGGRGIVEQKAIHPSGEAVAPCSNATSSDWYFADGFTVDGATDQLILTNPFPGTAIVDVSFALEGGSREPSALQGLVVNGNSVLAVNLGEQGALQQTLLAVHVHATFGRVVAGKEQRFLGGGGRLGYVMALGAASLDSQWWFADGERGAGISEQYVIYNPSDETVEADVVLLGIDPTLVPDPSVTTQTVSVPARSVRSFAVSDLVGVPDGRHSAVVSTSGTQPVVVERVLSRPVGDNQVPNTTVVLGQPSSYVAATWHVPIGITFPITDALVVYNTSFNAATITVSALGPGGAVALPGLEEIPVAASGVVTVSLEDAAVNASLVVTATSRVIVERRLARGDATVRGRSGSFAIPEF